MLTTYTDANHTTYYYWHDKFGKLFDDSYCFYNNVNGDTYYIYNNYHDKFETVSYTYFNSNYDLSYLVNNICTQMKIKDYSTSIYRGLRVDRLIDSDTIFNNQTININNTCYSLSYYEFNWLDDQNNLTYLYHTLPLHIILVNRENDINYNSYVPILRTYRSVDVNGIYNDLIFSKPFVRNNSNINNSEIYMNIPIVGAKQSLCLALDIPSQDIFNGALEYYSFTDYLFIYNNTNIILSIIISDPSLSLVSNYRTTIHIQPNEMKIYYPNNFNYNDTLEENKNNIYTIKLLNSKNEYANINFNTIK